MASASRQSLSPSNAIANAADRGGSRAGAGTPRGPVLGDAVRRPPPRPVTTLPPRQPERDRRAACPPIPGGGGSRPSFRQRLRPRPGPWFQAPCRPPVGPGGQPAAPSRRSCPGRDGQDRLGPEVQGRSEPLARGSKGTQSRRGHDRQPHDAGAFPAGWPPTISSPTSGAVSFRTEASGHGSRRLPTVPGDLLRWAATAPGLAAAGATFSARVEAPSLCQQLLE